MGIKDYYRFHKIVEEGTRIVPTENMKALAIRYIEEWAQLIQDRKNGKEVMPLVCLFGRVRPEYDRKGLETEEARRIGFERAVRTLCAIAEYDFQKTMDKMLS